MRTAAPAGKELSGGEPLLPSPCRCSSPDGPPLTARHPPRAFSPSCFLFLSQGCGDGTSLRLRISLPAYSTPHQSSAATTRVETDGYAVGPDLEEPSHGKAVGFSVVFAVRADIT